MGCANQSCQFKRLGYSSSGDFYHIPVTSSQKINLERSVQKRFISGFRDVKRPGKHPASPLNGFYKQLQNC